MYTRVFLGVIPCLAATLFLSACTTHEDTDSATNESDGVTESASDALTKANIAYTTPGRAAGSLELDASLSVSATSFGCTNSGGPEITIAGDLVIGSFGSKLTASNNLKFTHTATVETDAFVTLHSDKDVIKVRKGGKYGVTGNPEMWLEIYDEWGNTLGNRIYLGRCNRPEHPSKIYFPALGDIDYGITTGKCSGAGGPQVILTGAVTLRGIHAKLILQNKKGTRSVGVPVEFAISVLEPGHKIIFDKRPAFGGVGGNPWFYATLTDYAGKDISDSILLGRCRSLEQY